VSRRMGLFVVARLAARHGIRVRLRPAASGGLTALVWLPDEAIMQGDPDGSPAQRSGPAVPEPVIGPLAGGASVGTNGALTSTWADAAPGTTGEPAVSASSPPTFAPLRTDAEEPPGLGPKRVPGVGPRPGSGGGTTGPLHAFRTVPRSAAEEGPEPVVTSPQPVEAGPVADAATGAETTDVSPMAFDLFSIGSQSADDGADASLDTGPHPVLGASATVTEQADTSHDAVTVPPADELGGTRRLPIFEAVESDWFRRGRRAAERFGYAGEASDGWRSPADEGWRAAEVVHAPSSGGVTSAGLPKRVPQANLVPGAATGTTGSPTSAPARSAAATRDRFTSFQRGAREGRAAAGGTGPDSGEGESSE
jgi:hypothetical protein